jgi:hypothetical protein
VGNGRPPWPEYRARLKTIGTIDAVNSASCIIACRVQRPTRVRSLQTTAPRYSRSGKQFSLASDGRICFACRHKSGGPEHGWSGPLGIGVRGATAARVRARHHFLGGARGAAPFSPMNSTQASPRASTVVASNRPLYVVGSIRQPFQPRAGARRDRCAAPIRPRRATAYDLSRTGPIALPRKATLEARCGQRTKLPRNSSGLHRGAKRQRQHLNWSVVGGPDRRGLGGDRDRFCLSGKRQEDCTAIHLTGNRGIRSRRPARTLFVLLRRDESASTF